MLSADILLLSNGPGEITTWVRPVVKAFRQHLDADRQQVRMSLILSPCPNASGKEVAIAQSYPEIDRIQAAEHFFPFLLFGTTLDNWDWRDRGVVVFLGGDQIYPIIIGKRLGYRTVIYGEWETRWHQWGDRYAVMNSELAKRAPKRYAHKFSVVGDLMADVGSNTAHEDNRANEQASCHQASKNLEDPQQSNPSDTAPRSPLIGLLPGSKPAKLAQGVPLTLAIAQQISHALPQTRFVIPVAPTLDIQTLAQFANPDQNPVAQFFGTISAKLVSHADGAYLKTSDDLQIKLWTEFPAYEMLAQCDFCLTTVGANTAELGALAVPMLVLLPTQQLDAMRAWDGIPGLLANLPGMGSVFARLINGWFLRTSRLLAWPNIWAGEAIVPEFVGHLDPREIAAFAINWLNHPETLEGMRDRLRSIRGKTGAATRLAQIIEEEIQGEEIQGEEIQTEMR
ncbi:MAG: lipid-A-disaccharide synthase [Elainellaceae cyanobacterium]